jgi:hypothetical protein
VSKFIHLDYLVALKLAKAVRVFLVVHVVVAQFVIKQAENVDLKVRQHHGSVIEMDNKQNN